MFRRLINAYASTAFRGLSVNLGTDKHGYLIRCPLSRPKCPLYPQKRTCAVQLGMSANSGHRQLYSIKSSASPRSVGGTVRPIALAVLRLMTSSNLVGCWTGRSAGLLPLSIRSTYGAALRQCWRHDKATKYPKNIKPCPLPSARSRSARPRR